MKVIIPLLLLSASIQAAKEAAEATAVLASIAVPAISAAPAIPGNEIMLFTIKQDAAGNLQLTAGKNITNTPGYDSQPRFSNDGQTIYYTHAVAKESSSQMDIYQYAIESGKTSPYLTTERSEYSPTPMPHKAGLSVVQVDEKGDQYLVILNNELNKDELDTDQPSNDKQWQRYSDLTQVGYFNWIKNATDENYGLWSFILNDNNGGDLYHQGHDLIAEKVSDHVGRSFITDTEHKNLYYVDKNSQPWRIKSRSSAVKDAKDIMPLPMGVEDFTLDSQGRFWAGRDNTLFVSTDQQKWFIVAEFNDPNLHKITRITTNPSADKIAIVFAEKSASE